ncbi:MAG: Crp/Fnr family transcriptional regulator [Burkholderiales bacterium]
MPIPLPILQNFHLLRDLPVETLARLSERMMERSFARREVVMKKGEPGQVLCFLIEGRLQGVDFTVDGREVGLYFVDPNDYFGELSVIDGQPRPEFVIAVARSRVATLPRDEARTLMFSTPRIAERVTTRLAQRLRVVSAQRTLVGLPNPAQRVCAQLVQLAARSPDGRAVIAHAPTHQEIAIMINASRETVTRVFQVLQARGVLRREGSQLSVENLRYLNEVAEGRAEPPKAT